MEETDFNSLRTIYPFWNLLKDIVLLLNESGQIEFANQAYLKLTNFSLQDTQERRIQWCNLEWVELKEIIDQKQNRRIYFDFKECESELNITLQFVQKFIFSEKNFYLFQQMKPSHEMQFSNTLLNNTDIAFLFLNNDFLVETFNNAASKMVRKVFGKDLLIGIYLHEIIDNGEKNELILEHLNCAISGNYEVFTHEFQLEDQKYWYEFHITPISGKKLHDNGVALVIKDISNHKKSELDIRKSEEIFRNTFNNINDPALLWQKKADGEIVLKTYNLAAGEISKFKFDDWIGLTYQEFYADQVENQIFIENVFSTNIKKSSEAFFRIASTSEPRWILSDFIKISDEFLLNILKDITERKIADIALAEKQRQYETLLKNLPGMVYRCKNDLDWTMEFVNDGCLELFGYQPDDLINNKTIAFEQLIFQDDKELVREEIERGLSHGRSYEINYRIVTRANEIKWVWERGQGIYDPQGQVTALEGFITDITERILFEQKAEKARRQAEALQEAMAELASQLDLSQVLRRILVTLKKVLNYDSATLFLKIEENLKVVAARGFTNTARLIDKTFPADDNLLREIQKLNQPLILQDASQEPRFKKWEGSEFVRGWMGVPLIRHGQFIGLMTLDSENVGAYIQDDAIIAQTFADEAAIVIENARLYERAQILATSDGLTGIYNRRHFYELAKNEFERSQRYHNALSVVMIDIDHFKYINDKFGHSAGDQVLIQFVNRVKNELRSTDILARYGGEEFAILLLESDQDEALQVAERIREVIAKDPFELQAAQPYITISLGVATNEEDVDQLDMLIDRSDKALYDSKQFGRNRVRTFRRNNE